MQNRVQFMSLRRNAVRLTRRCCDMRLSQRPPRRDLPSVSTRHQAATELASEIARVRIGDKGRQNQRLAAAARRGERVLTVARLQPLTYFVHASSDLCVRHSDLNALHGAVQPKVGDVVNGMLARRTRGAIGGKLMKPVAKMETRRLLVARHNRSASNRSVRITFRRSRLFRHSAIPACVTGRCLSRPQSARDGMIAPNWMMRGAKLSHGSRPIFRERCWTTSMRRSALAASSKRTG
jgi:hypothetical protein